MAGFPNVPDLPGVPPIPRDPNAVVSTIVNLVADALGLSGVGSAPVWGIFLDGDLAIEPDNIMAFGFKKTFSTPSYPIEQGGFESYNKVQRPFTPRIRVTKSGSIGDRYAFLQDVDAAVSSLNLYDVVTPEATYSSVSLNIYDYNRSGLHGAGMLIVDIEAEEIRQTASSAFSSTGQSTVTSSTNTSTGSSDFIGTASPAGTVQSSEIADMSNPQLPQSQPFTNGGNVQPQQVTPGSFDISAVVQP